jgi:hypothetical protein
MEQRRGGGQRRQDQGEVQASTSERHRRLERVAAHTTFQPSGAAQAYEGGSFDPRGRLGQGLRAPRAGWTSRIRMVMGHGRHGRAYHL